MSRKGCELCTNPARMFCDSDQASLCWDCDEKVHAANFLVAKHSRTLLCHVCFSPTPWKAAGPSLGPTVSVCHACARRANAQNTTESETEPDREYYSSETDDSSQEDDDEDEDDDDDDDEEGENQVVPWSASASDSAPAASSSAEEEEEECVSLSSSKRSRDDAFAAEEVSSFDACCSSGNAEIGSEEFDETNYDSLRFVRRRASGGGGPSSGTAAIVEKLRRFEQQIVAEESDASAMIVGICNLTTE